MKWTIYILLIFPLFTFADDLESNWKSWQSKDIATYKYNLITGAGPFGYSRYKVKVVDGVCKAKTKYIFRRTPWFWKKTSCENIRFADLYMAIRQQIEAGVHSMDITYDQKYNFVSSFSVVPDTKEEDTDWYFEVTDFKNE